MAQNTTYIKASPQQVFDVLLDPQCYPEWVVGAKSIRGVDPDWPQPGAAFHHAIAPGGQIKDKTEVLRLEEPTELLLEAYARPFGVARVHVEVEGSEGFSRVTVTEFPAPGSSAAAVKPVLDPLIHARNIESLRRLKRLVEERSESF